MAVVRIAGYVLICIRSPIDPQSVSLGREHRHDIVDIDRSSWNV